MKRNFKRALSLCMAVAMVLSLAVTANAAGTKTYQLKSMFSPYATDMTVTGVLSDTVSGGLIDDDVDAPTIRITTNSVITYNFQCLGAALYDQDFAFISAKYEHIKYISGKVLELDSRANYYETYSYRFIQPGTYIVGFSSDASYSNCEVRFEVAEGSASQASFSDIPEKAWYADTVAAVRGLGIIDGVGKNKFNPDGTLTLAQAVTLAAKTHAFFDCSGILQADGPWYNGAVQYACQVGILDGTEFDDYTRAATRGEMAYLFSRVLDFEYLEAPHDVTSIPDVPETHEYFKNILTLYQFGITQGKGGGKFDPDSTIKRSEAAAIILRLADSSHRI